MERNGVFLRCEQSMVDEFILCEYSLAPLLTLPLRPFPIAKNYEEFESPL